MRESLTRGIGVFASDNYDYRGRIEFLIDGDASTIQNLTATLPNQHSDGTSNLRKFMRKLLACEGLAIQKGVITGSTHQLPNGLLRLAFIILFDGDKMYSRQLMNRYNELPDSLPDAQGLAIMLEKFADEVDKDANA